MRSDVLMRCDHVASVIVHANHDRMGTAVVHCVRDSIADGVRFAVPEPTEWQHIAGESDAGTIRARAYFVNVFDYTHYWQHS